MSIKVHFNHPNGPFDKSLLVADIIAAKQRLVMASAWFTDTDIAEAFIIDKRTT